MSAVAPARPAPSAERQAFYKTLDLENMAPLWEVLGNLVPREPRTPCVPAHWDWSNVRRRLLEAGDLITASEAERRVLVLENPGVRGDSSITHSLYAGIQLLLPGEIAPSHRHTANAIRLILEGEGGYTSVDGERASMYPGDFIITPSWTYHDHGNPGSQPVIWLDGLDVPIVKLFDAAFSDPYPHEVHEEVRPRDDAVARYSGRLLPVNYQAGRTNPVFRYPYEETRLTLDRMFKNGPLDPHHGVKLRYAHPGTGGWPTPTMAAFMQLLPKGFEGRSYRTTDATVFCAFEGSGVTHIGTEAIAWGAHDVFVAPSWMPVRHETTQDAVLFSMSDRPAQQTLGIWREGLGG